ncbi:class I SAM-dependent methyltransferase [Hydrogenibacillus sp. N12]|uniref:class I SAM-dependent methyltransferase n=1 Tax=Hydrogenibacillus sp. N12 TaxID=2866627 RepID=UPI001C7CB0CC|nr:class I SAM-dependent methyltransferase [Hydrogenibacillus sp. N12]QZA33606.1 class I SAM-dependent methyltransferase [Hydrogenibacillus sp. N12]
MELFPRLYDPLMAPLERLFLERLRRALLRPLAGEVLEIGVGTGRNLPFYGPGVRWTGIEPNPAMRRQAERRLRERGLAGALIAASAEALPFADGRFDAVVSTLVLCSVQDPRKALAEIRRVLKPGGRFLALEHVRIDDPRWAGWALDRLTPAWSRLADGCHLNRLTDRWIAERFAIEEKRTWARGVLVWIVARKEGRSA